MSQAEFPTFETILYDEPRPGVARVTLNRPEKRNAQNMQMTYPTFNTHKNILRLIRYLPPSKSPSGTTCASFGVHTVSFRTPPGAASMPRVS